MQKSRIREYSYTILLSISLLVVGCIWQFGGLKNHKPSEISHFLEDVTGDFFSLFLLEQSMESVSAEVTEDAILPAPGDVRAETVGELEELAQGMTGEVEGIVKTEVEGNAEIGASHEAVELETKTLFLTDADLSYFDDALFIGDSRTVGLYEYGGLGNAEVFAHSGMSIYKVFNEKFVLRSGEETTLEEVLSQRQFGKIYIMLGINELGYDFEQTVNRFQETLEIIQKKQENAIIFIQANLHITKVKSEESDLFNNENIDRYNEAISKLADGKSIFYLDANSLYDDADGCLAEEFTTDHTHILGKYYVEWVDYILENAVVRR